MIPNSHFSADGKFPSLGTGYDRKRGHYVHPFWDKQCERWQPMIDGEQNLRQYVIAMNVQGNKAKGFRHFNLIMRGLIEVFGDHEFDKQLEAMRTTITAELPKVWVSERRLVGQGMTGFTINLVGTRKGQEAKTLRVLADVINKIQVSE